MHYREVDGMHKNRTAKSGLLAAMTLISLTMSVAPSQAIVNDYSVFGKIQQEKNTLLNKEQRLLQDFDDLQRQLRDLQKRDNDPRAVDELCRDIDKKYVEVQDVRYNLRQLDLRLL